MENEKLEDLVSRCAYKIKNFNDYSMGENVIKLLDDKIGALLEDKKVKDLEYYTNIRLYIMGVEHVSINRK